VGHGGAGEVRLQHQHAWGRSHHQGAVLLAQTAGSVLHVGRVSGSELSSLLCFKPPCAHKIPMLSTNTDSCSCLFPEASKC